MGNIIREWLIVHGVSMRWIAMKLGMSPQTLHSKLSGRTRMTAEEYGNICNILGIPLDYFYAEYIKR